MINSQSRELKPVFAAYINMARQNAYNTLLYITKAIGLEEKVNKEANMWEMKIMTILGGKGKAEHRMKIRQLLYRHFGLLRPWTAYKLNHALYEKEKESGNKKNGNGGNIRLNGDEMLTDKQLYEGLVRIFKLLNYWRNKYSHFHFVDDNKDDMPSNTKDIAAFLDFAFDGARKVVKERFGIDEGFFVFLTGNGKNDRMLREPIAGQFDKRGRQKFRFVKKRDFRYSMTKIDGNVSDVGILAFICLFLHKKYETELVSQTKLVDGRAPKEQMIMREALAVYRIRLPKQRISSTSEKSAVGMDILGELHKCPDELFQTFCPEDQEKFRNRNIYDEEVLYKRNGDRFPWFVLRYTDVTEAFSRIRFQVSLGCLRHKFYNKQCIDSKEADRVRVLQKDINGFGRLEDMEEKRNAPEWNKGMLRKKEAFEEDTADTKPYITDKKASYIFHANRVAMWWGKGKMYIPEINETEVEMAVCEKPKCWMSIYDLQGMMFHHLLTKDDNPQATEKVIINCVERYQKLYSDIKDGTLKPIGKKKEVVKVLINNYGVEIGNLQEKLVSYLTRYNVNMDKRLQKLMRMRLEDILQRTSHRLEKYKEEIKMIGAKDNKFGKKRFVDIRPGRLASFLVRDMVEFQPADSKMQEEGKGTGKMTGLNYTVLQGLMATEQDILNIQPAFKKAGLLDSTNPSIFLKGTIDRLKNCTDHSIYSFYKCYLQAKQKKIETMLKNNNFSDIRFFMHPDSNKWKKRDEEYYTKLAETYMDTPVELPRSLFAEPIKEVLREKFADNKEMMAALNSEKGCNVTYLIDEYFKHVCCDGCQNFYMPTKSGFKRHYSYFDILYTKKKGEKIYYTIKQLAHLAKNDMSAYDRHIKMFRGEEKEAEVTKLKHKFNDYNDNEKIIRRYKVQDMLLFLMAKDILITLKDANLSNFKLMNISLDSAKGILEKQVPFDITVNCVKDGETKMHTIHQDAIKIKNYGDFFKFLSDDRIKSLLGQLDDGVTIDREDLEEELKRYDDRRVGVFRNVHEFEESVINKHEEFKTKHHNFKDLVEARGGIDKNEQQAMRDIRNAFGHNHYAETDTKDLPKIAVEMVDKFGKLIEKNKAK